MKAMILAAGAGTRLASLTQDIPKALVNFQGKPLLELVISRLKFAGFNDLIINVHHFADQIADYVAARPDDGTRITLSHEEELLDTGGGIKKAIPLLGDEPVLFHNVDILSNIDLRKFYDSFLKAEAAFMVAVKDRSTSRNLLFTQDKLLAGWNYPERNLTIITRESRKGYDEKAFSGIYIIDPSLFKHFPEESIFSITPWMIELSKDVDILSYDHSGDLWFDLGRMNNFKNAERKVILSTEGTPALNSN